jgi:hypothetical protein
MEIGFIIHPIIMGRVKLFIFIALSILFSCSEKISDEQFEEQVFNEIFSKLVDSTYRDMRIYAGSPGYGKDILDQHGNWIGKDTTGQHQRNIDHESKLEALKKDTTDLIIAIGKGGIINNKTALEPYNSRKFIFKHLSELPRDIEYYNWKAKYAKFAGVLVFTNIKFDVSRESGFLEVGYYCGGRCGLGYKVTIKKMGNKWVIIKVEDTWIS